MLGNLLLWTLLLGAGFLIGRNYERKHPITEEEAKANAAIGGWFKTLFKKDK